MSILYSVADRFLIFLAPENNKYFMSIAILKEYQAIMIRNAKWSLFIISPNVGVNNFYCMAEVYALNVNIRRNPRRQRHVALIE
jgi:hypothetical protein